MTALRRTVLFTTLALSLASVATASTSQIPDPANDFEPGSPCSGQSCLSSQDILLASLDDQGTQLVFSMTLAEPVGPILAPNNSNKRFVWAWRLDTDPATFPAGHPLPNGQASPFEMFAAIEWDGAQFFAELVDRRPLLTGGEAVITPLTPVFSGNEVSVTVSTSSLGLPSQFRWRAATNNFHNRSESMGQFPVDTSVFTTHVR